MLVEARRPQAERVLQLQAQQAQAGLVQLQVLMPEPVQVPLSV